MAVEVLMPKLGATMEKGVIIEWLKKEGDVVAEGEPILEIMTDKINLEVEATATGVILKTLYDSDTEVPVMLPIAYIGEPGEKIPENTLQYNGLEGKNSDERIDNEIDMEVATSEIKLRKLRRTPAALKLAKEHGVDLLDINGSGPNNRIHRIDVELYIANKRKITPLAERIAMDNVSNPMTFEGTGHNNKVVKQDVESEITQLEGRTVNYKGIRKVVGERMAQSWKMVPHVTLNSDIDMTATIKLRNHLLPNIEANTSFRLSYTEIIIKAVAHALKAHPLLNATLKGDQIKLLSDINIGLAVSIPNGLVVPVIKNVDKKGLGELTEESKKLAKQARDNTLKPNQIKGSTFTISNLGMYDVNSFTPIINQPESAILGIGRIQERVVSEGGGFVSKQFMTLSLSFDHRIIDGAPAAHFLTDLKNILENPYQLLV